MWYDYWGNAYEDYAPGRTSEYGIIYAPPGAPFDNQVIVPGPGETLMDVAAGLREEYGPPVAVDPVILAAVNHPGIARPGGPGGEVSIIPTPLPGAATTALTTGGTTMPTVNPKYLNTGGSTGYAPDGFGLPAATSTGLESLIGLGAVPPWVTILQLLGLVSKTQLLPSVVTWIEKNWPKLLLALGAGAALLGIIRWLQGGKRPKTGHKRRRYSIGSNPRLGTLIKVSRHTDNVLKKFVNTARHRGLIKVPSRTRYVNVRATRRA